MRAAVTYLENEEKNNLAASLSNFTKDYAAIVAILAMGLVFSIASPYFLTAENIKNILLQSSALAIVAMGQAIIMLGGQFDLSLGQCVLLTSSVAAYLMKFAGVHPAVAILAAMLLGIVVGLTNGILFAHFRLPAFIATLGLQMICRSLSKIITNATPIATLPKNIAFIGRGYISAIPICVLIMVLLYGVAQFVSRRTRLGRNIYAIGGGSEAAFFAGINIKKYYLIIFALGGLMAAIGGIVLMSRLDSVSLTNGNLYEFDAIIACVIGGISLTGGRGKIVGALFGTVFLVLFFNGMTMLNVEPFYQDAIKGFVLILAITADALRNRVNN